MNGRERIINTIHSKETDSLPLIPITMSIAADEVRIPYLEYATNYKLQAAGQIAIAEKYDFDHVSVISDPGVEVADCGGDVVYEPNEPPGLNEQFSLLIEKSSLVSLKIPDPAAGKRMSNRIEAVSELKRGVGGEKLVEGWIEGPAAESADLRGINRIMMDFFDDSVFVEDLLEFVCELGLAFADAQIEAGADIIGIGDAAASLLSPDLYLQYIHKYQKKYIEHIHAAGAFVRLHICGNINHLLPHMRDLNIDIIDLDSLTSVSAAREHLGTSVVLAGNIDPVSIMKDSSPAAVREELGKCFDEAGRISYAVSAGCEIPRGTSEKNMQALRIFARQ